MSETQNCQCEKHGTVSRIVKVRNVELSVSETQDCQCQKQKNTKKNTAFSVENIDVSVKRNRKREEKTVKNRTVDARYTHRTANVKTLSSVCGGSNKRM